MSFLGLPSLWSAGLSSGTDSARTSEEKTSVTERFYERCPESSVKQRKDINKNPHPKGLIFVHIF
jgi:hypothetical protein